MTGTCLKLQDLVALVKFAFASTSCKILVAAATAVFNKHYIEFSAYNLNTNACTLQ